MHLLQVPLNYNFYITTVHEYTSTKKNIAKGALHLFKGTVMQIT